MLPAAPALVPGVPPAPAPANIRPAPAPGQYVAPRHCPARNCPGQPAVSGDLGQPSYDLQAEPGVAEAQIPAEAAPAPEAAESDSAATASEFPSPSPSATPSAGDSATADTGQSAEPAEKLEADPASESGVWTTGAGFIVGSLSGLAAAAAVVYWRFPTQEEGSWGLFRCQLLGRQLHSEPMGGQQRAALTQPGGHAA